MKHTSSSEESTPWFLFRLIWSTIVGIFVVMPCFTLMYIGNEVLRAIVNFRLRKKYGTKTTVLDEGSDAVWLYRVENGKRQILYLAINEEPMDLERHRKNYMEKVLNRPHYQKLKQIFTQDFGFNIQKYDTNFDIRNHVKYFEGSEDRIITEKELMDHVLPVLSEEMDDSKPQWEDVIIPRFKYENDDLKVRSARVFRIHHSYMDGGSNLLMIAESQFEGEGEYPYVVDPTAPPKIALWKRALYKFNCFLLFGWVVIHGLYAPTSKVVRNRFRTPTLSGQTNYAWSKPIPMNRLKYIKDTSGESMPTILMSVLGGAIRKLNEKFPTKDNEFLDSKEQDEITVGMVAGVFPYPDYKLKNRHSIFHMKIDVSDKTAFERLEATSDIMKRVMWDPHVYLNYVMPTLFGRTPIWFSDACMKVMGFPLVLSNIPVARERVKLWGNDVLDIGGWPPMLSICGKHKFPSRNLLAYLCNVSLLLFLHYLFTGIGLVTIRYGDNLRVCVNSDKAAISKEELDFLISHIKNEVDKLAEEVTEAKQASSFKDSASPVKISSVTGTPTSALTSLRDSFHNADSNKNSLKFRLHNSISSLKGSLNKLREP